ncbi:hypothetical protein B296_00058037 [Ensete ventricosum]|uniref:Uncharacterized protein n=1 Tax=Ensete ventricosum TaxID=4639 RepID=A0A426XNS6_ENSVE|nr:hypothetical protein B296_00058037 [Ensete ventricosum]
MANLLGLLGEGPLEARWASLTLKSQVWASRADAQLVCWGLLCPPLVKEIYTSPSKTLLDNAAKNLVMHHHFSIDLIDRVYDSKRVVNELSKIIDGLRVKVRKLKEEAGPVVVAIAKARVNEVTQ